MLDTDNTTEFILIWEYSKTMYRNKGVVCSIQLILKGDCIYADEYHMGTQITVQV